MEYGSLSADGKQDEDSRLPDNPDNPYGFSKFPMGFNVDVIASARGQQTYKMNKNSRYYDMSLSTKLARLGHAAFLFMSNVRDRVSYIYPTVNAAGAGLLLSETFTAESMNLSEETTASPRTKVSPLSVNFKEAEGGCSRKSKECRCRERTKEKQNNAIYNEMVLWNSDVHALNHLLQLAALNNDSTGVKATNTAAIQLATARQKPSIASFSSKQKGRLFILNAEHKKCTIVSSKTGMLADIEFHNAIYAMQILTELLAPA
ncbi:photosynthetic NDH subunit of subcomplex B 1, chloroplastic-like [Mangifera indica]|uniref:photosynthetic NDH subunit of subcomplex B 1, chloroplastic-like n=1 Tax=Mangifera indica TaxID=29780 RepID=UPI001CFABAE3|nr:photosynthetic NDH subunit of subcomplex B 1, chloroplastic-like [Mangifera indica]